MLTVDDKVFVQRERERVSARARERGEREREREGGVIKNETP